MILRNKSLLLLLFSLFLSLTAAAQPSDGYYRMKNKATGEYAALASDVLSYNTALYDIGLSGLFKDAGKATAVAKMGCYLQNDIRMTSSPNTTPGSVFYIKTTTKKGILSTTKNTNLYGQGTNFYDITYGQYTGSSTGTYTFGGFYPVFTSKSGAYTLYIEVKYNLIYSMGKYYFTASDGAFGVEKDAASNENAQWYLEKAETFNVAPLSKVKDGNGHYWTTLCVDFPFSVPASGSSVVAAYTVVGRDSEGYAVLEQLNGTVAGGTPCLIECTSDDASTNILTIETSEPAGKSCADGEVITTTGNYLQGRYFNAPSASYSYLNTYKSPSVTESLSCEKNVLKNDQTNYRVLNCVDGQVGFYKLKNANSTMGANKAFLNLNGLPTVSPSANAKIFGMEDPGDATGINATPADNDRPAAIYDLQGRRVDTITHHGIYIINGKKVVR